MPANDQFRDRPDTVGVDGPRRIYTPIGLIPEDAVATQRRPGTAADSVQYWSDAPYIEPYNERAICAGTRTDKQPCKAKAEPGERFCGSHASQG